MMQQTVLQAKNIGKSYNGNQVLRDICFEIHKGEILALVGENGAGKSTLMNILFGMPVIHSTGGYSGDLLFEGKTVRIDSPEQAMALGIGMVHQEFMLIPGYTITENIKLNREITGKNPLSVVFGKKLETLNYAKMANDARTAMDKLDLELNVDTLVQGMPVGYMQFVEIAREIDKSGLKLLVFDEPTAVLTQDEAERLLTILKHIAASGIAIIYISHRLNEVISLADTIVVLRDGEVVTTREKQQTNVTELSKLMVGREIAISNKDEKRDIDALEDALVVEDLSVRMPGEFVRGASFTVKKGEIFGLAGLAGQGKVGVANGIMGLYEATGKVTFMGREIKLNDALFANSNDLAFVSEDRRNVGLLLDESIEHNIMAGAMFIKKQFLKRIGPITTLDKTAVRKCAQKYIDVLDIRCTGPGQLTRRLSGGNQQKVCIARALVLSPKLLFISEPTRGIDVGAKALVLDYLHKLNVEEGITIVVTSSELAELRSICDRIAIMTGGRIVGTLLPEASDAEFGMMMSGSGQTDEVDGGMRHES